MNTAFPARRLQYKVVIGNGDEIQAAKLLMLATLKNLLDVEADATLNVLLLAYAGAGVALRMRWWVKPPRRADTLALQDQVLEKVNATPTEHGIDLPYPTQQILFHDQTETMDVDRRRQREGWPPGHGDVPRPAWRCGGEERAPAGGA